MEARLVKQIETTLAFQQRLRGSCSLSALAPVEVLIGVLPGLWSNCNMSSPTFQQNEAWAGFMSGRSPPARPGRNARVQGADAVKRSCMVEAGGPVPAGSKPSCIAGTRLALAGTGAHRVALGSGAPAGPTAAARVCLEAMFDQALQFRQVSVRQFS